MRLNLSVPDISKRFGRTLITLVGYIRTVTSGFIALESPNDGKLKGVKLQRQKNRKIKLDQRCALGVTLFTKVTEPPSLA